MQRNCARYFEIRKYAFLTFEMGKGKKTVPGFLEFLSVPILIFEKEISKKTLPGVLRFVSVPFFNI